MCRDRFRSSALTTCVTPAFVNPSLTTVHLPLYEVGALACERLIERVHGKSRARGRALPTHLVVRESTAWRRACQTAVPRHIEHSTGRIGMQHPAVDRADMRRDLVPATNLSADCAMRLHRRAALASCACHRQLPPRTNASTNSCIKPDGDAAARQRRRRLQRLVHRRHADEKATTARVVAKLRTAEGVHHYKFVVDGDKWTPDPAATRNSK